MSFIFYFYSIINSIPVFNYVCVNMAPEVRLCSNLDALVKIGLKKKLFPKKQVIVKITFIQYKILEFKG